MADDPLNGEQFEVFDLLEPQALKTILINLFMGYLKGNDDACNNVWHQQAVEELNLIYRYLDNPLEKDPEEVLKIVNAHKFLRLITRLALGNLWGIRHQLPEEFGSDLKDIYPVFEYLLYIDE